VWGSFSSGSFSAGGSAGVEGSTIGRVEAVVVWGTVTSVAAFLSRLFFVLLIQSAVFIHILRS
jgi:hypothetical protein